MDYPDIQHHGAADGVTGSCHRYLASDDLHLLIDCGLFQGENARADSFEQHRIEFDISAVKALIITHVHIDHIGRLPYLLAAGFTGPIYCSAPSARLIPLVIEDALKVGFTRDRALIEQFLAKVGAQLRPLEYRQWQTVEDNDELHLKLRLQRAGHILGSAWVEIDTHYRQSDGHPAWHSSNSHRTVFSGDLGAPHAPLLPAPKSPWRADTVVIESTYGNREHENRRSRRQRLKAALEHALQNQGTVMIPAFSIGRTQELLYELEGLIHDGSSRKTGAIDWTRLQVIVDSPLAARFTRVYRELRPYWDAEAMRRVRAGRHPLDFDNLYTVDDHDEHEKMVAALSQTRSPAVVLAASGMAAGGRIVNYLRAMLGDPAHALLFVGYQAPGTPGHALQQLAHRRSDPARWKEGESIELDGQAVSVRARIETIGGYSAHADRKDLLNFVRRMRHWPSEVRIVHGDNGARSSLRQAFESMAEAQQHPLRVLLPEQYR